MANEANTEGMTVEDTLDPNKALVPAVVRMNETRVRQGFWPKLARTAARIEGMGDEAEASALAASFLSDHLRVSRPPLSQRFLERAMSLTQTVAQIRSGASMRDVQIEQPIRLIGAIQNVALVMVPGFLGSIASLTTMLENNRKLTPTEAGELSYQLRNILQQLKE